MCSRHLVRLTYNCRSNGHDLAIVPFNLFEMRRSFIGKAPAEPRARPVLKAGSKKLHARAVLERCYNCDIIEGMPYPNKSKKDPITEWAVGQPLVMQTEQETTRKTKLGSTPTLARVKKAPAARQNTGARKKTVSKPQRKKKRTSS